MSVAMNDSHGKVRLLSRPTLGYTPFVTATNMPLATFPPVFEQLLVGSIVSLNDMGSAGWEHSNTF